MDPMGEVLYVSDTTSRRVYRVRNLGQPKDPSRNLEVVAGTGEQCLPFDQSHCGEGRKATEAALNNPRGRVAHSTVHFIRFCRISYAFAAHLKYCSPQHDLWFCLYWASGDCSCTMWQTVTVTAICESGQTWMYNATSPVQRGIQPQGSNSFFKGNCQLVSQNTARPFPQQTFCHFTAVEIGLTNKTNSDSGSSFRLFSFRSLLLCLLAQGHSLLGHFNRMRTSSRENVCFVKRSIEYILYRQTPVQFIAEWELSFDWL